MLTIAQIKDIEHQVDKISIPMDNDFKVIWNTFFKRLFYLNYLMAYLRNYFHDNSSVTKDELKSVPIYYNEDNQVSVEEMVKYIMTVYPQINTIDNIDEFIKEAKRSEVGEKTNRRFADHMIKMDAFWTEKE